MKGRRETYFHLEVVEGDLVRFGMGGGQGFKECSMVTFSLEQITQLLQHGGAVRRYGCVARKVALGDASELGEQLLGVWIFIEQTRERER